MYSTVVASPLRCYGYKGWGGGSGAGVPIRFRQDLFGSRTGASKKKLWRGGGGGGGGRSQERLFPETNGNIRLKARLHMRFFVRFRCDFAYKTCPSLPRTGFQSRNAATKYRQVSRNWKEGCLQIICHNFLSNPRDASRKKHSCRVG